MFHRINKQEALAKEGS